MGQKAGEKWTAEAVSQPTIPKPDRLLGINDADTEACRAAIAALEGQRTTLGDTVLQLATS